MFSLQFSMSSALEQVLYFNRYWTGITEKLKALHDALLLFHPKFIIEYHSIMNQNMKGSHF